jgi:hypothetical protein
MTPKEKAKELFEKMQSQTYSYQKYAGAYYTIEEIGWEAGKKCALIAVDEIIEAGKDVDEFANAYWQEVKQEIDNLC